MLAVRLFMPPVPRRAISPKQTPGPRVTKMMLSLGPPTTLSNDKTEHMKAQMLTWTAPEDTMNISIPTSPFLQM